MKPTLVVDAYTLALLNRSQSSSIASIEIHGKKLEGGVARLDLGKRIFIDPVPKVLKFNIDEIVAWATPLFREHSLLTLRKESLEDKLEDVLTHANILRKCVENNYSDTYLRLVDLERAVREARVLAAQVEDLQDIAKYGKEGGR